MTLTDAHSTTFRAADRIRELYEALARLPDLEPGRTVNGLFSELVRLCRHREDTDSAAILADPAVAELTPALRDLCSRGEYLLERAWAHRVTSAEDPHAELTLFPYLANYEELVRLELHALRGVGLDLAQIRRACFLGGGPFPLSALLMSRELGIEVDSVDVSAEATGLATGVVRRLGGRVSPRRADAARFEALADSQVAVLGALVGPDRRVKREVLAALHDRMAPGSMIVVRSAWGLRSLLYPPVDLADLPPWQPLAVLHPLNDVVNSVVVALRR